MLLSYKVKNFRSFFNMAEFEMYAPNNKVKKRFPDNYIRSNCDVLKTAVIIGENAGGKTNFINSFEYLKSLFLDNQIKRVYNSVVNINNLSSDKKEEDRTSQYFELEILAKNEYIYDYVLEIDSFSISREVLTYRTSRNSTPKVVMSVERNKLIKDGNNVNISFQVDMPELSKELERIIEESLVIKKESFGLFITKLAILGNDHASQFVEWINNSLCVESKPINYDIYKSIEREEDDIKILKDERFLEILRMVDYSICAVEIDEEKPFSKSEIVRVIENGEYFRKEIINDSSGVSEFFAWAVQIFRVVYENKVVIADEMDRVINPILADRIIAFINGKNHKGQFIFSSHNVLHLDLKTYMKEQIYFITKNKDDLNSELYSLADFPEIRYETTKIYEFYMKGILGGTAFE